MWVILTLIDCVDWAFRWTVGVRTTALLKLGNQNKNKKSHNFVIGTESFLPGRFRFFCLRDISAVLIAKMSISPATCLSLSGGQYGWASRRRYHQLVELFEGEKKLKIETVRSVWNFQISWPKTRAIRNKNKIFFNVCDLFYLFFADIFIFDITQTFEEWGHSNFPFE